MPEPIVATEPMPEPVAAVEAMSEPEPVFVPEPEPIVFVEPMPAPIVPVAAIPAPVRPVRSSGLPLIVDAPAATATVQEAIARIEAFVQSQSFEAAFEPTPEVEAAPPPPQEQEESVDADDEESDGFVELDLSQWFNSQPDPAPAMPAKVSDTEEDEPFVYEIIDDDFDDLSDEVAVDVPADVPEMVPEVATVAMSAMSPRAAATNDREAWIPTRLGVSQLWPPMDGIVLQPPVAARGDNRTLIAAHTPSRRAVERQKPVQDEWGFFDPEQCGFAALLAKLDEIVDTDDATMEKSNLA